MSPHDFKKFPELTNNQMEIYYFASPHKQITESFRATVVKVTDGDSVRVKASFRNFDFALRLIGVDAPELGTPGGLEAALWLRNRVLGKEVDIIINPMERVGKWGRLLGDIMHAGESMAEAILREQHGIVFGSQEGRIPEIEEALAIPEVRIK